MKKPLVTLVSLLLLAAGVGGIITHLQAQNRLGAPMADVLSAVEEPKVIKAAQLTRGDGASQTLGEERILLAPKETVAVHLGLKALKGDLRVVAPNGGTFNKKGGSIIGDASKLGGALDFQFTPGNDRGRYTVEVTQGNDTQILEFWVGDETPQGKPGPALIFKGN